jgi:signal transduction histidine kinase
MHLGKLFGKRACNCVESGQKVKPEALSHALDPFFKTKDSGTGLGLSISFEIVQAHDGELTLSNHSTAGTVALIRLPLTTSQPILVHAGKS